MSELKIALILLPETTLRPDSLQDYLNHCSQLTLCVPPGFASETHPENVKTAVYDWNHSISELHQFALNQLREMQSERGLILDTDLELTGTDWDALKSINTPGAYRIGICFERHIENQVRLFVGKQAHESELKGSVLAQLASAQNTQVKLYAQGKAYNNLQLQVLTAQSESTAPDLLWYKGWKHFLAQEDLQAEHCFKALSQSKDFDFWNSMGRVMLLKTHWEMGQNEQVFQELEGYHAENPEIENIIGLWILRGVMAKSVGEKELASECFQQAIKAKDLEHVQDYNLVYLRPELEWKPQLGLADLVFEEGLFSMAYKHYEQVSQSLTDNDYVLSQLLKTAFFTQRHQVIETLLENKSRLRGISAETLNLLEAFLKFVKKQALSDAETTQIFSYSEQYQRDPFLTSVALELAIIALQSNETELSQKILEAISVAMPNQVVIWHNLALTYFRQKNYDQAEQFYRKGLECSPQHHASRMDLAKTLYMQHRRDEARAEFEKILSYKPDFFPAQKALEQLEDEEMAGLIMPATGATAKPETAMDGDLPFVFVFPTPACWQDGADIALRAYLKEFIPEDNVIFAFPEVKEPEILESAKQWAETNLNQDILPPVKEMDQPLPLPPGQAAWVFPWRQPPSQALQQALLESGYAVISTGMPLKYPPGQLMPVSQVAESAESGSQTWFEVDVEVIQNQMRLAWLGELNGPTPEIIDSHSMLQYAGISETAMLPENLKGLTEDSKVTLSVCMIVKDEAEHIERCLESIHEGVDEIIVVDTGSSDQTKELVKQFAKVKLYETPWNNDFAAARNVAVEQATQDWILSLDADEYVAEDFLKQVKVLLNSPQQPDLYAFPVLAIDKDGSVNPQESIAMVPRLFPNDEKYRYRGQIHEMIYRNDKQSLDYFCLKNLPIFHVGYQQGIVQARDKYTRDRTLMEKLIEERPEAPETSRIYSILAGLLFKNGAFDEAEKLYKKGLTNVKDDPFIQNILLRGLAQCLLQKREFKALIPLLQQDHKDPKLLMILAEAYFQVGDGEQALEVALDALQEQDRQFLKADPLNLRQDNAELFEKVAQLAQKLGEEEQALYFFKRAYKQQANPSRLQKYQQLQNRLLEV